ncbi:MFS transporter [Arthrobacter sp. NamB2]|uniref:MFS transporter n=1 Tax=Arthrobacter sp. NamB2 TaxID=2576035 RepID=UPI0010C994C5|nr:MFS transporter [Arthrobacter sp. NamB2]TKV27413.1 MFS transporter [Arthrobacter sp. NamB2]
MKHPTLLLIVCCTAQLIVVLDSSILTVALPHIASDLAISPGHLPWIVNAFAIPMAGLLLFSGKLSDRYGARPLLLTGTVILMIGNFIGGLAPDMGTLICARISQGIGAALMSPATLSLLSTHFPTGPARARAFGLWGAAAGSGGAIGVLAGGLLVDAATWRWSLLVNIPLTLGLITVILALRTTGTPQTPDMARGFSGRKERLDVAGAAAGTIAVTALVLAFATTEAPLFGVGPILWAVIAVVALCLFVLVETRWSAAPLIPLQDLTGRRLWVLPAAMFLIGGAMTATFYFLTLSFQINQGLTALETGSAFLPMSVAAFLAAANTHNLTHRLGTTGGALASALTMTLALGALAGTVGLNTTPLIIVISVLFGAGMGVAISTLADLITAALPTHLSGISAGILTTAQHTGNTIGLASLVALDLTTPTNTHGPAFAGAAILTLTAAILIRRNRQRRKEQFHSPVQEPHPSNVR